MGFEYYFVPCFEISYISCLLNLLKTIRLMQVFYIYFRMKSDSKSGRYRCDRPTSAPRSYWRRWLRRRGRSTARTARRSRWPWGGRRPPRRRRRRARPTGATSTSFPRPTRARRCSAAPRALRSSSSELPGTWLLRPTAVTYLLTFRLLEIHF